MFCTLYEANGRCCSLEQGSPKALSIQCPFMVDSESKQQTQRIVGFYVKFNIHI